MMPITSCLGVATFLCIFTNHYLHALPHHGETTTHQRDKDMQNERLHSRVVSELSMEAAGSTVDTVDAQQWKAWKAAYPELSASLFRNRPDKEAQRRDIFEQNMLFMQQRGGLYELDETTLLTHDEFRARGKAACSASTLHRDKKETTALRHERATTTSSSASGSSASDFKCTVLSSNDILKTISDDKKKELAELQEIDYRGTQVTPVKNQGAFGTCWSFGFIETIEGLGVRQGHSLLNVSNQEVIDCCPACRGSAQDASFGFVIQDGTIHGRLATDFAYPYTGSPQNCSSARICQCQLAPAVVEGCVRVMDDAQLSGHDIFLALALVGPGAFGIDASCLRGYKGGVITNCTSVSPDYHESGDSVTDGTDTTVSHHHAMINHEVLLVGAGIDNETGVPYFRAKNSWGTKFGEEGYFRFARQGSKLGMGSVVFAASALTFGLDQQQPKMETSTNHQSSEMC